MTPDEIAELALIEILEAVQDGTVSAIDAFTALDRRTMRLLRHVRQRERKACAKIAEERARAHYGASGSGVARPAFLMTGKELMENLAHEDEALARLIRARNGATE